MGQAVGPRDAFLCCVNNAFNACKQCVLLINACLYDAFSEKKYLIIFSEKLF